MKVDRFSKRQGQIYFVADSEAIKIGFSIDPIQRLAALPSEFPHAGPGC